MTEQIKNAKDNGLEFLLQLGKFVVAVSFLGLGGYGVYLGRFRLGQVIGATLLIFAGAVAVFYGLAQLYKTLMHKK